MEQDDLEAAMSAVMRALAAISERLERDLVERDKIVTAFNAAVDRIASLEKRVGELDAILASMRDLH
jgi:hypothetical protein